MLEPVDPWQRPRWPGHDTGPAGPVATTTADRPGDHVPLPALPVASGWARRRGIELLQGRGLHPDTVDAVSLLISELVTNALLHGLSVAAATGSPARCAHCGGQLCLNLREEPGEVLIEVFDPATLPPRRAQGTFNPTVFNEGVFEEAAFGQDAFDEAAFDETPFGQAERGRGLMLVANLSEEQGFFLPPAGGKVVWCVVKADV